MSRCLRACALAVALAATRTSAQEQSDGAWEVELSVPLAALTGHTTYRIQAADPTGSVESELEFPLGGFVAGGRGQLASQRDQNRRRVVFEATALLSFTGSEGTLKDSDWLSDSIDISTVGAAHPGKDIYSESKARLSALVLEGRAAWELEASPGLTIAPLVGVLYQRFGYEVRDVVQVGYGPYAADFTGSANGSVLDYEVRYRALYAGARGALVLGSGTLAAEAWYSPFAHAEDRDDHMLRSKLSTSDADGSAWQAGVSGRLALGPSDALQAQLSLVRFTTTGTQLQRFYAGPDAGLSGSIDTTITSSRTTVVLVYSHRI